MSILRDSLRKVTPRFILDLVWRYKFIKQTEVYSQRPFFSICKLGYWMFFAWTNQDVPFKSPDMTKFVSMPSNLSSFIVCFSNYRDPAIHRFMLTNLKPNAVYVDAGANIGTYTIRAAQHIKDGKVISFEAHPLIYGYLKKNIALNGLKNVQPVNLALGAENGFIEMAYTSHNAGETHVAVAGEQRTRVALRKLDDALRENNIREINYLKIDVEGFELPLLRGAQKTIQQSKDIIIQTELNETHAHRYGNSINDLTGFLSGLNLVPHAIGDDGRAYIVDKNEIGAIGDALWWREEIPAKIG